MSAYDRLERTLETAITEDRELIRSCIRAGDAMTSLVIFCALEGFSRSYAARAIGCEPEDLDKAVDAFHASVSAERKRRQERAS